MSVLRLASGLFLLPLILHLDQRDQGFYYLLVPLLFMVTLLDFGLASSVERSVSYAMGGAKEIKAHGMHASGEPDARPNYPLLWRIVHTTRAYYAVLASGVFAGLGSVGTWFVASAAASTSQPTITWIAWALAVVNAGLELYSGWWSVVLRGMNGVVASARIVFFCHALKLALCGVLLWNGWGLIGVFAPGLLSSFLIRLLSRLACLRRLPSPTTPAPSRSEILALLQALWPNSWRVAVQLLSGTAALSIYGLICSAAYGLAANARYGLSLQVATIAQGVAAVWVNVKWPTVGQLRARQDRDGLLRLLRPRFFLMTGTYVVLALAAASLGPALLALFRSKTQLLPFPWFLLLLTQAFLDLQLIFWTSLLGTENRVPWVWPTTCAHLVSVVLIVTNSHATSLGLGVFVLVPFLTNCLFNYWYWPIAGARSLGTSWIRFVTWKETRR